MDMKNRENTPRTKMKRKCLKIFNPEPLENKRKEKGKTHIPSAVQIFSQPCFYSVLQSPQLGFLMDKPIEGGSEAKVLVPKLQLEVIMDLEILMRRRNDYNDHRIYRKPANQLNTPTSTHMHHQYQLAAFLSH